MTHSSKAQRKGCAPTVESPLEGGEAGGTLIEYVFLATLIGMAAIAAMNLVGLAIAGKLDEIASVLT